MDIVIDTNIFVHAKEMHSRFGMNCLLFLTNFLQQSDRIALDYNGEIMREYQDNISGDDLFFQKYFVEMHRNSRFIYGDSKIDKRKKDHLISLGFHEPEDHIFVGVALNTGKIIVTDDSDYGANGEVEKREINNFMRNTLKLDVLNSEQAKERYIPAIGR